MVVVALVAVFALSAVAASSALATPEWYVKKAGKFEKVKEAVKVQGTYSWDLVATDPQVLLEPGGIALSAEFEGELKSGGIALLKTMNEAKGKAISPCQKLVGSAGPSHLPWNLELYKEGTEVRSKILNGGSGAPEYKFECEWFEWGDRIELSNLNTSIKMTNLTSNVEGAFDTKSAETECRFAGPCKWTGVFVTVKPIEKSGVEAIKVE